MRKGPGARGSGAVPSAMARSVGHHVVRVELGQRLEFFLRVVRRQHDIVVKARDMQHVGIQQHGMRAQAEEAADIGHIADQFTIGRQDQIRDRADVVPVLGAVAAGHVVPLVGRRLVRGVNRAVGQPRGGDALVLGAQRGAQFGAALAVHRGAGARARIGHAGLRHRRAVLSRARRGLGGHAGRAVLRHAALRRAVLHGAVLHRAVLHGAGGGTGFGGRAILNGGGLHRIGRGLGRRGLLRPGGGRQGEGGGGQHETFHVMGSC
ncbi:pentapeptide repeat-containing protein [Paracoccus sp. (in: a-proteobacteria)]|uniref:pentapeptide repeat-containing protein n=1 Tax=Paracoccus sp. TaxID=267 RepID=UPI003FA75D34